MGHKPGPALARFVADRFVDSGIDGIKRLADKSIGVASEILRETLPKDFHVGAIEHLTELAWMAKLCCPPTMFHGDHQPASRIKAWLQLGQAARELEAAVDAARVRFRALSEKDSPEHFHREYQAVGAELLPICKRFDKAACRLMDDIGG